MKNDTIMTFLNALEGFRLRTREIHWSTRRRSIHGGVSVEIGYYNDQFIKNELSVLAEWTKALQVRRPDGFCWAEKVDECQGSIRTGGEHPTVIASIPDVMACAGKGMTIGKTAEYYGISESTLRRNLKDVDRLGEYNSVLRHYRDSVGSAGGEPVE